MDLHEADGMTTLTYSLAFRDKAGRDHMTKYDGLLANFDNVEDCLARCLARKARSPGNCRAGAWSRCSAARSAISPPAGARYCRQRRLTADQRTGMYQYDPEARPDSEFAPGELRWLVTGNTAACSTTGARRSA